MSLSSGLLDESKYEILRKLGAGGMGEIYQVRHKDLDDVRVAKVIHQDLADKDDKFLDRFHREARIAARLKHPGIAQLHDLNVMPDGTAVIVMEFIDGMTLLDVLHASKEPPEQGLVIEVALQGLDVLGYLHEEGYVHRDISPDNVMLTRGRGGRPQVKLIDLGLAKRLDTSLQLTATGAYLGKVRYSAPEQFGEAGVDARSDIYSFGVMLYELLTGVLPIKGEQFSELVGGHLVRPPRDFQETDPDGRVPPELRRVVLRTLEKRPEDRTASAAELARQLEPFKRPFKAPFATGPQAAEPVVEPSRRSPRGTGTMDTAVTIKTEEPGSRRPLGASPPALAHPKKRGGRVAAAVMALVLLSGLAGYLAMQFGFGAAAPGEEDYGVGLRALDAEDWNGAARALRAALEAAPRESAELVEIAPGRREPYLPHYHLGVALFHLHNYETADAAWGESEQQGVIRGTAFAGALADHRRELAEITIGPAQERARKLHVGASDLVIQVRALLGEGDFDAGLRARAEKELAAMEDFGQQLAMLDSMDFKAVQKLAEDIAATNDELLDIQERILDALELPSS